MSERLLFPSSRVSCVNYGTISPRVPERLLSPAPHLNHGPVISPRPHDPQVFHIDLDVVSAMLEVSLDDLVESLAHGHHAPQEDELHITAAQVITGSLSQVATFTDDHLGTHFRKKFDSNLGVCADYMQLESPRVVLQVSSAACEEDEHEHGCIINLGQWKESAAMLPTAKSMADFHRSASTQLQAHPNLGNFQTSMMDLMNPGHHESMTDVAAILPLDDRKRSSFLSPRPSTGFIIGSPGNISALVVPEVEDIIDGEHRWHLPSAMKEVHLVVESDFNHQPHVFAYITYVRPLIAWCLLLVGWFCYSAIGPIYSFYPTDLQLASFRVAAWRNFAALLPFLFVFLIQLWFHGMSAECKHFLCDRVNWPLILAGSMGSFWASTATLMAVGYGNNFPLVAVLSSMHPYLMLMMDSFNGKALSLSAVAVLAGGSTGALCMMVSDAFQSLISLVICAVASGFLVMYVKSNYRLQALLPFPCLMSINFGMGTLLGLVGTFLFEGTTLDWGPNSLAWVLQDEDTFWITLCLSVSYMCGIAAFVACGKHIPILVTSVAIAMEPETSVIIESMASGAALPQGLLLLGILMVTATKLWLALVSFWERKKELVVDVTDAVHTSAACFSNMPSRILTPRDVPSKYMTPRGMPSRLLTPRDMPSRLLTPRGKPGKLAASRFSKALTPRLP